MVAASIDIDFLRHAQKYRDDPVLIVGMHNSGTSILAEVIKTGGVFLGANSKHQESHFFSVFINDQLIMGGGSNWATLPIMSVGEVMAFKDAIGGFITTHWIADYLQWGYDGASPWGFKDPRLCVLLPLYLELFPAARVVHIRRDLDDVAASLCGKDKPGVGQLDDFDHWRHLAEAYVNRVSELSGACRSYHALAYEDFCRDSGEVIQTLFDFLGLEFTEKTSKVLKKVSPERIGSFERRAQPRRRLRNLFARTGPPGKRA